MEDYKYLNGLKVGDKQYFKNLEEVVEGIWGKKEQGKKPDLRIFDDYDFIEKYSYSDRTDEIDFYLCFPTNTIHLTDLISFAESIEINLDSMKIITTKKAQTMVYWNEKVIYQDLIETQHVDTDELINVGHMFVIEVEKIKKDEKPVNLEYVQAVLSSLTLENGWHWGIRFAEISDFGDKSWFYCHQGDGDTYCEDYVKSVKSGNFMTPLYKYYDFNPIYDIYQHLNLEWTEMGVWQAYLLSKATALLPVVWHGGYGRKTFLFCKEDIARIPRYFIKVEDINVDDDLSPKVRIEGNVATVSCCFWNDWRGLYRETEKITLKGTKIEFSAEPEIDVLFKYISGMRY